MASTVARDRSWAGSRRSRAAGNAERRDTGGYGNKAPRAVVRSPEKTLIFRPRVAPAEESLRPTRAEIDLGAIAANLRALRKIVGAKTKILAVVKADAYGHGVVPVALRLQDEGVHGFGVALAEEGL